MPSLSRISLYGPSIAGSLRCLNLPTSNSFRPRYLSVMRRAKKNPVSPKEISAKPIPLAATPPKLSTRSSTRPHHNPRTSISTAYQTYSLTLAQKLHSTLLYTAPSSLAYHISCYTASTFCIGYGILSYWNNYLFAPPDIAPWVPYAFSGISVAMVLFGIRFLRGPLRMVRRITASPKTVEGKPSLEIEIELKRMIPALPLSARIIKVAPHEIVIPAHLPRPILLPKSQIELRHLRVQENLRKQQELEYERSHIMSAGVRHIGRAISTGTFSIFRAVQKTFTRDDIFELRVRGKIYKMDLDGGWLLDQGKAIDRLATLEPHSNLDFLSRLTR